MKVTVFGGGGFIGSTIADRLLKDGHELRIFERPRVAPYRSFTAEERVEWVTGDMMSAHDVGVAVDGVDAVFHLVSSTLPGSSNDDMIFDVESNLVATLRLLGAMVDRNVRRIVFISSGGTVYGDPVYIPIDEKHPTDPRVSYGVTKLAIEKYLLLYQHLHGIKATILRVANPFGPRQRVETAQGAVAAFLHRAIRGQPIEIWGDGSVTRDYIYVGDVADAFASTLGYKGSKSIFNISSGSGTSLNQLILKIEKVLDCSVARRNLPGRDFDVPVSILDNSLARTELGWQPSTPFEGGLALTADWARGAVSV